MAQEEYESIAAFAELGLDLMAAGAPTDLVTKCHEAALEEASHTKVCLRIARSFDGESKACATSESLRRCRRRPRLRAVLLSRIAVESYVDGCLGEASSARVLSKLGRTARSRTLRKALARLAREEMSHARLSAEIVQWCIAEGGDAVLRIVTWSHRHYGRALRGVDAVAGPMREFGVPDAALRRHALCGAYRWAEHRLFPRLAA